MRSPAAAIAWEFRRRHRWGWIAIFVYFVVLVAIRFFYLGPAHRIDIENEMGFALAVVIPLATTFIYFLAVFGFGLAGDLAARQSIFPTRMFTLPVTSSALAGWPMLYGALAMITLWFATRMLALWPKGETIPVFWPALLGASLLAWTQALTWMPYPLPGMRVVVTVLWLVAIDAIVMIALELKASEGVMLAILAPNLPLAYLVAQFAVRRARRGDVPDWRTLLAPFGRIREIHRRRIDFTSAARAQLWFEWRRHGWSLPAWVTFLLPFELSLLFIFRETPVIVFETLLSVLITPPFMASFVAAAAGKANTEGKAAYGLPPFLATRPMTSAALIAAKLKMMAISALAAWVPVLVAVPLAVRLSGTAPLVAEWGGNLTDAIGRPRAIVLLLLGIAILILSTWKQLVQSLYLTLSGRAWLVKGSVAFALTLLGVGVPVAHWVFTTKAAFAVLWNLFPWILGIVMCIKLSAAAWIAVRLEGARLLSVCALVAGAIGWDLAVFALFALLVWLTPAILFFRYFLALVAILTIPLARLAAAPLALAWNRHRP